MSKAISRLPHQVMASKSKGEGNHHGSFCHKKHHQLSLNAYFPFRYSYLAVTKDLEFEELEKKFLAVQKQADTLLADAQAFRDGVAGQSTTQPSNGEPKS
jgi:hypothetical protein